MSDPARVLSVRELADSPEQWPVVEHRVLARGNVTDFVEDVVTTPHGDRMRRQYTLHPGAVGVIALDAQDRVAVVLQYRHPAAHSLIEPPAGLLDLPGEDYLVAAQRELAEEAGLAASDWRVLVDLFTTPGATQESVRIYLARGLTPAPRPDGFEPESEEAVMEVAWAGRADIVDAILDGRLQNPVLVAGVLALEAAEASGRLEQLRPADAPWPSREVRDTQNSRLSDGDAG